MGASLSSEGLPLKASEGGIPVASCPKVTPAAVPCETVFTGGMKPGVYRCANRVELGEREDHGRGSVVR